MNHLVTKTLSTMLCVLMPISMVFANPQSRGGGSDGGGNTYKGKPLESYAKNPTQLAAYRKLISPLLQDLKSKETNKNSLRVLSNLIRSAFSQKIWYFVPGPLEHIPADLLNSAVRTDQAVLQGFDRVWIDEDIWNAMAVEDQAKLILHEAFMGLKILQFGSNYRLCLAAYDSSAECKENGTMDVDIKLTPQDYFEVQKMTIVVAAQFASMNNADWMKLIRENGLTYPYDWFEEPTFLSQDELSQLLTKSQISGYMPTHGYNLKFLETLPNPPTTQQEMYEYLQKNKEDCKIEAEINGGNLQLKLLSKSESFEEQIPLPQKIESYIVDLFQENKALQKVNIPYATGRARPQGGFTYYGIAFFFDSYRLSHVHIQEMVCRDKNCDSSTIDAKGGALYICSANSELFKP